MADPPGWTIEPIRRDHAREDFDCGNASLDEFLRKYARQSEDLGLARTFVAVRPKEPAVRGYYSLRLGQVHVDPVAHLARLAADRTAQGQGLGETLLLDALERILAASRAVAAYAVEVVAADDSARAFYIRYGFKELVDDRLHLYLPMRTVARLFEKS